jgi:hypothetical protein
MLPEPAEILVTWPRPPPAVVWRAIDVYLPAAYGDAPLPAAVRRRLEMLPRDAELSVFYACSAFELIGTPAPGRYALRLGNSIYPHMKMLIGPTPGGGDFLFRADTHDRHVQVAPDSPEYRALCEMLAKNHAIGTAIESAWESAGLPTFKQYLRQDLARRRTSASSISPPLRGDSSHDASHE